jgi:hypothetical protein
MHKEAPPSGLRALFDVLDKTPVLGRHKWLPYRLWFRNELAGYIGDALNDSSTLRLPFLNHRFLPTMARDHNSGRHNHVREIYATLTLAAVDRLLVRGDGWQLNRRSAFAGDQQ